MDRDPHATGFPVVDRRGQDTKRRRDARNRCTDRPAKRPEAVATEPVVQTGHRTCFVEEVADDPNLEGEGSSERSYVLRTRKPIPALPPPHGHRMDPDSLTDLVKAERLAVPLLAKQGVHCGKRFG